MYNGYRWFLRTISIKGSAESCFVIGGIEDLLYMIKAFVNQIDK